MNHVVVFGGSGLVGAEVLHQLIKLSEVTHIATVTRRELSVKNNKLLPIISDLESVDDLTQKLKSFAPKIGFCCLGSTLKKAGSKKAFAHIDHDLILNAARASYEAGARSFGLISSSGANANSPFFYLKVKGSIENDLQKIGFDKLVILRPGLLLGKRSESRPLEAITIKLSPFFSPLFRGPLKKYRPSTSEAVARKLIHLTINAGDGVQVVETQDIH